jgi:hypothetical protein
MKCITFDPVFNTPVDQLHEDSLRTGPTAPESPECNSEQDNKYHQGYHSEEKQVEILRPEPDTKQYNVALYKIQQKQRLAVYPDKWRSEKECQQYKPHDIPPGGNLAFWLPGIYPDPAAFLIDSSESVAKIGLFLFFFFKLNH